MESSSGEVSDALHVLRYPSAGDFEEQLWDSDIKLRPQVIVDLFFMRASRLFITLDIFYEGNFLHRCVDVGPMCNL